MQISLFGFRLTASSAAGKLALLTVVPLTLAAAVTAAYLTAIALASSWNISLTTAGLALLALSMRVQYQTARATHSIGLLPWDWTRTAALWSALVFGIWHHASHGHQVEMVALIAITSAYAVMKIVKEIHAVEEEHADLAAQLARELTDIGYGTPRTLKATFPK